MADESFSESLWSSRFNRPGTEFSHLPKFLDLRLILSPFVESCVLSVLKLYFVCMDPRFPESFNHRTEVLSTGRKYHFVCCLESSHSGRLRSSTPF